MARLEPFHDDEAVLEIAGLTLENGTDAIRLSGDLSITRDKAGKERCGVLLTLLERVMTQLSADEAAGRLPERIASGDRPSIVSNPLA